MNTTVLGMRLTGLCFAILSAGFPFVLFFLFVCFPKKPYIYSANYNLLGIFAPGCVFRSTATVDLEFGSTLTWVLYHLEVIEITVCLEVALVSCVHEQ